jgi:hypothetical protein
MSPVSAPHAYTTILSRRWCLRCDSYQVYRGGRWQDVPEMLGPWPGYSRTEVDCPGSSSPQKTLQFQRRAADGLDANPETSPDQSKP